MIIIGVPYGSIIEGSKLNGYNVLTLREVLNKLNVSYPWKFDEIERNETLIIHEIKKCDFMITDCPLTNLGGVDVIIADDVEKVIKEWKKRIPERRQISVKKKQYASLNEYFDMVENFSMTGAKQVYEVPNIVS